jgi:hypothetical protein
MLLHNFQPEQQFRDITSPVFTVVMFEMLSTRIVLYRTRHEDVLGRGVTASWILLTSALYGGEWSASRPGRFIPVERAPLPIGQEAWWAPEAMWTLAPTIGAAPARTEFVDLFRI